MSKSNWYTCTCILLLPIKEQLKAVQGLERDVAGYKPQMDELELVHQVRETLSVILFLCSVFFSYANFIHLFYSVFVIFFEAIK